jgi:signal transduction histidine kinase
VAKHSGARRAVVSLAGKNDAILLTIKDSGHGFDAARSKKRGLGLISMEERVRQAGGAFTVKSTPGKGVNIDVRIPLAPPKRSEKR